MEKELNLKISLYQLGIVKVEICGADQRFKISDYDGVSWENLALDIHAAISIKDDKAMIHSHDEEDLIRYELLFSPFRINIIING